MSRAPFIRPARPADIDPLRALQAAAMRALGAGYYTPAQVEAAVRYVCVPDPELIEDGTYLVAELDGRLVGCGGWTGPWVAGSMQWCVLSTGRKSRGLP